MSHYSSFIQDRRSFSPLSHTDRAYCHAADRPHAVLAAPSSTHWQQMPLRISHPLQEQTANTSQFPTFLNSFSTHESEWPMGQAMPASYTSQLSASVPHTVRYATHADYPESSQRTNQPSSPANMPPSNYRYKHDTPRSPSRSPDCSDDGNRLYTMDGAQTPISCRSSSVPSPSVKMEQPDVDGCFVMELSAAQVKAISLSQSMAPPTEVPLRATHASEEMRKMMGRFRIDPFAIHNGEHRGVVASWCGGEACPLEEEPLIFEFQVDLEGVQPNTPKELPGDLQPELELHKARAELEGHQWEDYCHPEPAATSNGHSDEPPDWNLEGLNSEGQASSEPAIGFYHQDQELHEQTINMSQHYFHKYGENDGNECTTYIGPGSTHEMSRVRPQEFWTRSGVYNASSRSSTYGSASPGCDTAVLPSISSSVNRRWSMPDTNLANDVQFLLQ
ncbi:hypothetical protein AX17_003156 [Amanita inopinata Kibby_2008]|nr:hypothetical protein AX17_003156 [Amanita inopinata Kibby_2008]